MNVEAAVSTETTIRELVQACLADDHRTDGVHFVDRLLLVAAEVGEIYCTLAGDYGLRFEVPGLQAWEVKIGRAKSKFRMLLPRFAVLCNESGGQVVSLYGGEGVIEREQAPNALGSCKRLTRWAVRFLNTPDSQELRIQAL